MDNALKYGTNATVHLAQEPERVVIIIDDDGPGIPPSPRDKVFEPFYRREGGLHVRVDLPCPEQRLDADAEHTEPGERL